MSLRKRATLACTHCHRYRVRCDAYSLGSPCTRCREDNAPCVLRERFIKTKFPGYQVMNHTERQQMQLSFTTPRQRIRAEITREAFLHYSKSPFLIIGDTSALDIADTEFLTAKGCLQVPAEDVLEDFLQQFFVHVQPYTPLLDESTFWSIYERRSGIEQPRHVHLLLFQAMLFASSPYIARRTLEKCGFKDQRAAWQTLYQRAKLLYNSPMKVDPITRAQTALLLTFYTSSDEPHAASLWLSHAIQNAKQASPDTQGRTPNLSLNVEKSLYNRLWCSILLRDRALCLGLRRRPQVLSFEINMMNNIPEETDFESEINGSRVYDPDSRRKLFIAFRELCQLAIVLAEVLSLIYGNDCLSLPIVTIQEFHSRLELTNSTQTLLGLWKASSEILAIDGQQTYRLILRFQHLATLYYQAARINIAHYQTLLIKKHEGYLDDEVSLHIVRAGEILSDAAAGINLAMVYFSISGKVQNPPLSLLGILVMPLVLSAINFKLAPTTYAMEDRRHILEHLGEVMSQLRRVYSIAESISSELDKILQLAYYASSKVFRQGVLLQQSIPIRQANPPISIENNGLRLRNQNRNWHDAFLQHTGVYLWISTTVDYYLSIGKMPHLDVPADYYFHSSQSDIIRTVCLSPLDLLKEAGHYEGARASESRVAQSLDSQ